MRSSLALIGVLLLAACGTAATPIPATHDINGTVVLHNDGPVYQSATTCRGDDGYDDIDSTTLQAVAKDDKGAIVGTAGMTSTRPVSAKNDECYMGFTLKALPDAPFYSVEVGHRGAVTYSKAELEAAGWKIGLSIGD
jgi:hypothetical protein